MATLNYNGYKILFITIFYHFCSSIVLGLLTVYIKPT